MGNLLSNTKLKVVAGMASFIKYLNKSDYEGKFKDRSVERKGTITRHIQLANNLKH
jgi:hypothetical protein